jgi:hypothetical protein
MNKPKPQRLSEVFRLYINSGDSESLKMFRPVLAKHEYGMAKTEQRRSKKKG